LEKQLNIALVGNPNSGKSSLFNSLTGLNQKVGNFPGVTVDKKTGISKISEKLSSKIPKEMMNGWLTRFYLIRIRI
jgi:ferrous iron transport protein B